MEAKCARSSCCLYFKLVPGHAFLCRTNARL
ncbi:MAG: (2Fe-2S)-binding protein [Bacteriovoracia bacterium]